MNFHSILIRLFFFWSVVHYSHTSLFLLLFEMNAIIVHDMRYSISNSSDCSPFIIQQLLYILYVFYKNGKAKCLVDHFLTLIIHHDRLKYFYSAILFYLSKQIINNCGNICYMSIHIEIPFTLLPISHFLLLNFSSFLSTLNFIS